ncbi:MAG TPA: T9SS type A sorting domain-containing protein [Bacteroidia bacterium]|nr:T9SS type A sorting domain-containing protein [Bacteroidia bacterium]
MKKLIISGVALFLLSTLAKAQAPTGLDSIIVEKYYVSDLNDKTVDAVGGVLPLNSVTYRIFVDMKPGYKFEAAYGVSGHELRFQTSTLFFNNEDRGATSPTYTKPQAQNNTVMLDSWLTVGGACTSNMGVMKIEDDGSANAVNADGVLQNNNALAGIPLTQQDGFLTGAPEAVTTVGITNDILVFDAQNDGTNGPVFSTFNGSLASLNGSVGPTATNRVLIGQITTDGTFCFTLNIQLGTPTAGGVENWVASNPSGNEGTHPTLSYCYTPNFSAINSIKSSSESFSVYPNPTLDAITIDVTKTTQGSDNSYTVYGVDGKVVLTKKLGSIADRYQERVDLSSVAPGLYFIELTLDGVKSTKKIVKN